MICDCNQFDTGTPEAKHPGLAEKAGCFPQGYQCSPEKERYRGHSEEAGTVSWHARYPNLDQLEVRMNASCHTACKSDE